MIKWNVKEGGPESPVSFFGIEIKRLGSIGFLKVTEGRREVVFYTSAFHAFTWFLKGRLREEHIQRVSRTGSHSVHSAHTRDLLPKFTSRKCIYRVYALEDSWCFTIRGPWQHVWREFSPKTGLFTVLTHGREIVGTYPVT